MNKLSIMKLCALFRKIHRGSLEFLLLSKLYVIKIIKVCGNLLKEEIGKLLRMDLFFIMDDIL